MLFIWVVACLVLTTVLSLEQKASGQQNGQSCDLCKKVAYNLDLFLQKNTSEAEIETLLRKICNPLPDGLQKKCEDAVHQYGPLIGQIVLLKLQSDQICTSLGLCPTNKPDVDSQEVSIAESVKVGDKCSFCEFVMPEMVNVLRKPHILGAVQDALNPLCQLLSPTVRNICQEELSKYTTIVVDILVHQLQHEHVCSQLGLCNISLTVSTDEVQSPSTDSIQCELCKLAIGKVKSMLSQNATINQIKAAVGKVCNLLPSSYKSNCKKFINKYGPQIIKLVASALSPNQICKQLGVCSADMNVSVNEIKPPSPDNIPCTLCKFAIDKLKSMLNNNATQDEIKQALEQVCDLLPSSFVEKCTEFIDKYEPQIIKMLLSSFTTDQICSALGLCSADMEVSVNEIKPPSPDNIPCTLCKFAINELKSILSNNATQDEIKQALEQVCDLLPSSFVKKCTEFIDKYEPQIIQMLLSSFTTDQICSALGLCSADIEVSVNEIKPPGPDNIPCTLCKFAINELKSILSNNATQDEIKQALEQVCDLLPSSFVKKCTEFIDKYEPQIIQMLLSSFTTDQICSALRLCSADMEVFIIETQPPSTDSIKCSLCKTVIGVIKSKLKKHFTPEDVEKVLGKVCDALPLKSECKKLVKKYGQKLVQLLLKGLSSQQICKAISLCKANMEAMEVAGESGSLMFVTEDKKLESMIEVEGKCEVCKILAEMIDYYIQKQKTVAEVQFILAEVCIKIIPEMKSPQCLSLVMEYTPVMVELLSQLNNPTAVCEAVKICARPLQKNLLTFLRSSNKGTEP